MINGINMITNKTINKNNTTGRKGISWNSEKRMYKTEVQYKGKRYYLAKSSDLNHLIKIREQAEEAILADNFEDWIEKFRKSKKNKIFSKKCPKNAFSRIVVLKSNIM